MLGCRRSADPQGSSQASKPVASQISPQTTRIGTKLSGQLMGVLHSMWKNFGDVWATGIGDMGLEIRYFDGLFQRNWWQ